MATATHKINTLCIGPINLGSMTATGLLVLLIDYKSYRSVPPPPVLRGGSDLHRVLRYEEEEAFRAQIPSELLLYAWRGFWPVALGLSTNVGHAVMDAARAGGEDIGTRGFRRLV